MFDSRGDLENHLKNQDLWNAEGHFEKCFWNDSPLVSHSDFAVNLCVENRLRITDQWALCLIHVGYLLSILRYQYPRKSLCRIREGHGI